jgi:hypothetical protein
VDYGEWKALIPAHLVFEQIDSSGRRANGTPQLARHRFQSGFQFQFRSAAQHQQIQVTRVGITDVCRPISDIRNLELPAPKQAVVSVREPPCSAGGVGTE